MSRPEVSVIVPVRLARHTVRDTLAALLAQADEVDAEVIATVAEGDPTLPELGRIRHERLRIAILPGGCSVPRLRREGVLLAQGNRIAITEDHCLFPDGWLRSLVECLDERGVSVAGGGVENGRRSFAGWAQYFARYSAFMPPLEEGAFASLPGNNACYRRSALADHASLAEGFWEAETNAALASGGCRFWRSAKVTVVQRQHRGLWEFAALRYRHGRCYGGKRALAFSLRERLVRVALSPLIAPHLLLRSARSVFAKRRRRLRYLLVSPLLCVYFLAWAAGESAGYAFGAGNSCLNTD